MFWYGLNIVTEKSGPSVRKRTVVRHWRRLPLLKGALEHERTSPTMVSCSPTTGVATSESSVAAT